MSKKVTILTEEPTIEVIADMRLNWYGVREMTRWVKSHRPECLPDDYDPDGRTGAFDDRSKAFGPSLFRLFPHDAKHERNGVEESCTDNELLAELAGRKCYDSFGQKAGKKTNAEYIANTQAGDVPHASILYHAKMSFFIAGVSRRVSHELIRNYVGADRDEEGSPSQESTRFTHHYGFYVAPPKIVGEGLDSLELLHFSDSMQENYDKYIAFIHREFAKFPGHEPKGMDRKRIYEAASAYLSHACETSFIWTSNPVALAKLFRERCHKDADAEFQRFAGKWKRICVERWPNLFPQPWMHG